MTDLLDQEPERRGTVAVKYGKSCLAVLVALAVLVGGGAFVWSKVSGLVQSAMSTPDYTNPKGTRNITVTVPQGASLTSIGSELQRLDVIKSVKAFDKALKTHGGDPTVQAGRYRMRTQVPAAVALSRLTHPGTYRISDRIQVVEGLRLSQQIAVLAKETKISPAAYRAALRKPQQLGLPGWAHNRPEGFLFPDTYELNGDPTATSVLKLMTRRFGQVSKELDLPGSAATLHTSPYDVVIVASIIEAEVRNPRDRSKVARVIYNRVAKGMPLQMDSTVHYAVHKSDKVTTTDADRRNPSLYNTYRHKGLPPGPISAPGKASLQAAAAPAPGNWLYFVTVNPDTGETVFSSTKAQHDAAVRRFQSWCSGHPGRC